MNTTDLGPERGKMRPRYGLGKQDDIGGSKARWIVNVWDRKFVICKYYIIFVL